MRMTLDAIQAASGMELDEVVRLQNEADARGCIQEALFWLLVLKEGFNASLPFVITEDGEGTLGMAEYDPQMLVYDEDC